MTLQPFKKLLTMSKDAINEVLAIPRAYSVQKKAELKLAQIEEEIASKEADVITACSNKDVEFDTIMLKLDTVAIAERRREQMKKIIAEMFPKE